MSLFNITNQQKDTTADVSIPVDRTTTQLDEVYEQDEDGNGDIEDEFDEIPQEQLNQDEDESIRERISKAQAEMHEILKDLDEEQIARYEMFRRIRLPAPMIKKVVQRTLESLVKEGGSTGTINQNVIIAVAGISKVFVGELVEEAKDVMAVLGEPENLPIHPSHLIEAQRRLRRRLEHKSSPDTNALSLKRKGLNF